MFGLRHFHRKFVLTLSAGLLGLLVVFAWIKYGHLEIGYRTALHAVDLKSQREASEKSNLKLTHGNSVSEFYQIDLVSHNRMVNDLILRLKSESEVIEETQRIHMNIFRKLIGKYRYAMLFNIAGFENKGDPAIGVGELNLLRKLNIELVFHIENTRNTDAAMRYSRYVGTKYSNETLVILLQGGGNLISYKHEDIYRERVLKEFMDYEVIMFPQSVWTAESGEHLEHFKSIYSMHPRLTFCYRDQFSFDKGSELFPKARPLLVPDMAFQVGKVERFMQPIHEIMWIHRTDKENPRYKIPGSAKLPEVIVADWWKWLTPKDQRTLENGFLITANGMMFLLRGRVVITDRLHGHILCILCGIPHVILDPINHKISHYRDTWTKGLENVEYATTPEEALYKARALLKRLDINKTIPKLITYHNSTEYDKNLKIPNLGQLGAVKISKQNSTALSSNKTSTQT